MIDRYEYDNAPDDAECCRCGDIGVQWNVEIQNTAGDWLTVCTDCERPADWPAYPCDDCDRPFTTSDDPDGLFCSDCYGRYLVKFNS